MDGRAAVDAARVQTGRHLVPDMTKPGPQELPSEGAVPAVARAMNDRATLRALLTRGPLTAVQIASITGVSKPTAYLSLRRLESAGIVTHSRTNHGTTMGPSPAAYHVRPQLPHAAGVHLTPRHVTVSVADATGRDVGHSRRPTEDRSLAAAVAATRTALAEASVDSASVRHVVVGVPAVVEPGACTPQRTPGLPGWDEFDFRRLLEHQPGADLRLDNDVNLAAVAEQRLGAATTCDNFITLWIDEGVGMGVVTNGTLLRGATGRAGEVDMMPVPSPGVHGAAARCFETVDEASLLLLARVHGIRADSGSAVLRASLEPGAGEQGRSVIDEYARRVATALAMATCVLDPELIVLCGDLLRAGGDRLRDRVERELAGMVPQRPAVALSAVVGDVVLAGAQQVAVDRAHRSLLSSVDT